MLLYQTHLAATVEASGSKPGAAKPSTFLFARRVNIQYSVKKVEKINSVNLHDDEKNLWDQLITDTSTELGEILI